MIDVVIATLATATAMGQQEYEQQLLHHLPAAAPELAVRRVRVRSLRSDLPGEARLPLSAIARAPGPVRLLAARLAYGRTRLVHRCDLRLPPARHEVVTVHDLAPLRFPDEGVIPAGAADVLRRSRAVVCPSQFAADEVAALLGVPGATVIHNGLDPLVWTPVVDGASMLAPLRLPTRLVLHSGGATRRKNLVGLARAWALLAPELPDVGLVLCGPPDPRRDAQFNGLPWVYALGRVPRQTHLALMDAAEVVVVPSTYEGFGFPALEALARGTAVVAAECGSLPEVCGDAALLSAPDGAALAAALRTVLTDRAVREDLAARGPARAQAFTWERCAERHAAVLRAALGPAPAEVAP